MWSGKNERYDNKKVSLTKNKMRFYTLFQFKDDSRNYFSSTIGTDPLYYEDTNVVPVLASQWGFPVLIVLHLGADALAFPPAALKSGSYRLGQSNSDFGLIITLSAIAIAV